MLEGGLLSWEVQGGAASPQGCGELLTPLPQTLHLQETVQILQAKVNMLDSAALDQVEARLQVGRRGGGRGGGAGPAPAVRGGDTAWFGVPSAAPPQSVLGKVNEIAKHKAVVQDADTQSKVRAGGGETPVCGGEGGCSPCPGALTPPRTSCHLLPDPPGL